MSGLTIAIDGPGGSGKSTVARGLAARLGLAHLDTGAMYRAIALLALEMGVGVDDDERLGALAEEVELVVDDRVLLNGEDVTDAIRSPRVNAVVSVVAARPKVRMALVRRQREWVAEKGGAVVEGRDIGSVVLPDATLKVYLTASEQERARRRAVELGQGDDARAVAATRASIAGRDEIDSTRSMAPLTVAKGAAVIDSTELSADEVIAMIVDLLSKSGAE